MPSSEKTKKGAAKAKGWLNKFFPSKGKTVANQGILGSATKAIRSRRKKMDETMRELDK